MPYRCQKQERIGNTVTNRIRNEKCQDESQNNKDSGYKWNVSSAFRLKKTATWRQGVDAGLVTAHPQSDWLWYFTRNPSCRTRYSGHSSALNGLRAQPSGLTNSRWWRLKITLHGAGQKEFHAEKRHTEPKRHLQTSASCNSEMDLDSYKHWNKWVEIMGRFQFKIRKVPWEWCFLGGGQHNLTTGVMKVGVGQPSKNDLEGSQCKLGNYISNRLLDPFSSKILPNEERFAKFYFPVLSLLRKWLHSFLGKSHLTDIPLSQSFFSLHFL